MNRMIGLCAKLKPKRSKGGTFKLDSFELRCAAFSARVTLKLEGFEAQEPRKSNPNVLGKRSGRDPNAVKNLVLRIRNCLKFLEREMKRAKRQFLKVGTSSEFKALSKEWRSHLRWMQYHLAYFKPFRPVGPEVRRMQWKTVDLLVAMAKKAIEAKGVEVPDQKLLRKIIRQFIRDCHRGRVGHHDFRYMLHHQQSPIAQSELFEYVARRLGKEKRKMRKNRGKTNKVAHEIVTAKPKIANLIEELAENFENWPSDVRRNKLDALFAIDDISIRGLARDSGISPSTLRHYVNSAPRAKESEVPREQPPLAKPQIAGAPRLAVVEQKASAPKAGGGKKDCCASASGADRSTRGATGSPARACRTSYRVSRKARYPFGFSIPNGYPHCVKRYSIINERLT
jgi:hypothetical protein